MLACVSLRRFVCPQSWGGPQTLRNIRRTNLAFVIRYIDIAVSICRRWRVIHPTARKITVSSRRLTRRCGRVGEIEDILISVTIYTRYVWKNGESDGVGIAGIIQFSAYLHLNNLAVSAKRIALSIRYVDSRTTDGYARRETIG